MRSAALACLLATLSVTGLEGRQDNTQTLETIHVQGSVYTLQNPTGDGNVGVFVGADGVLLVDAQFAPRSEAIVSAVRELSTQEISFLVICWVRELVQWRTQKNISAGRSTWSPVLFSTWQPWPVSCRRPGVLRTPCHLPGGWPKQMRTMMMYSRNSSSRFNNRHPHRPVPPSRTTTGMERD